MKSRCKNEWKSVSPERSTLLHKNAMILLKRRAVPIRSNQKSEHCVYEAANEHVVFINSVLKREAMWYGMCEKR